ncbi:hypothetical protein DY000_02030211 [Brassica cretica]|uniref:Uncharacterized protein n=1 Tax=Brassica cretica TaxID=69181 RepID=A0ABQ7DLI8_BRACR|nr:hypothetical protein DY000_02030211 [Brassica cretica]
MYVASLSTLLSVLSGGLVMTSLGLPLSLSVFADLGRVEDLGFAGVVALPSYWSLSALLVRFLALGLTSREFQMLFLVLACDSFVVLCSVWWLVSAPICFLVCGGCTLPVQMWGLHFLGAVRQPIKRGSKSFRPLISSSIFM